ncbi:MAG: sulfatase-like hydrolase/transferase, partial [bacterium]|nr:sulfatase-like hydrolase/transferase [bacterium]
YFDPHMPYEPPGFDARLAIRTPYDGEIGFVDTHLKRLLDAVEGTGRPTLVVLTADHGEGLGEHHELSHGLFAYGATLRVPLIVRFADRRLAGSRIPTPVSLVDILPSVLEWLGLHPPADLDGTPLPLQAGAPPRPLYFENRAVSSSFGWAPLEGVVDGDWKLIRAPRPELYDLKADPFEERNIHDAGSADVERLSASLEEFARTFETNASAGSKQVKLAQESLAKLRALGYLSVADPAPNPDGGRDPKDMVKVYNTILGAGDLIHADRCRDAADLLLPIVTGGDPNNFRALEVLAMAAPEADDLRPRLIEVLREKLLHPAPPETHTTVLGHLGRALMAERRYAEALESLEQVLEISPNLKEIYAHIGDIYRDQGETGKAVDAYQRSLAGVASGSAPPPWVERVREEVRRLKQGP